MLKNATILLIRHGEKPGDPAIDRIEDGTFLIPAGRERALAYIAYFQSLLITDVHDSKDGAYPFDADALFAAQDSKASHRPRLTLEPVAVAAGLDLNCDYPDSKSAEAIGAMEAIPEQRILVCWHHGTIIELANKLLALAGPAPKLPPESLWPKKWPGEVFGWTMQIRLDANRKPIIDWTKCRNQRMMFDDKADPPADAP
jgi:hypothetical protein